MKTLLKIQIFLVLASVMLACQDEQTMPAKGHVQFSVDSELIDPNSSGRTAATIPQGASLLLSMEDDSGNPVLTLEKVDIVKFGDQYATAPIALEDKSYKLTDFMIVDANNEVIYATPRQGSALARLVKRPLPVSFTVAGGKMTNVSTQVVRTTENAPEDFGYVSFSIDIAAFPEFSVSVFAFQDDKLTLTAAQAYLIHNHDTLYRKSLGAKINEIIFRGEPEDTYTFVLIKPGYGKYSRTFTLQALKNELNHKPLEIVLQPALTMTAIPDISTQLFMIIFSGVEGKKVTIDWGDGVVETVTLKTYDETEFREYWHGYSSQKSYFVSITGDIDFIKQLRFDLFGGTSALSLIHMTGLETFGFYFSAPLEHVDFSNSPNLTRIGAGISSLKSFNITANKKLKSIHLEELPLTTEDVDKIINDVYNHAVANNIYNGYLSVLGYGEDGEGVFMGPPSAAAMQKLQTLQSEYQWSIQPSLN